MIFWPQEGLFKGLDSFSSCANDLSTSFGKCSFGKRSLGERSGLGESSLPGCFADTERTIGQVRERYEFHLVEQERSHELSRMFHVLISLLEIHFKFFHERLAPFGIVDIDHLINNKVERFDPKVLRSMDLSAQERFNIYLTPRIFQNEEPFHI